MSVIPPQDTLKYINQARTNPSSFANYVKKQIGLFTSQTSMPLFPGCNYSTNEGKKAWTEAYNFLIHQKSLPKYELNDGLTLAAQDHAIDMAKTGIFGHNSSNGQSFSDRIKKRCGQSYGASGQNIGSQFKIEGRNHALQTVLGLIIDDGVPNRGHRKNIFSTDFKYVGISSRVQNDKIISVLDFHSQNQKTINGSENTSNTGNSLQYDKKGGNNSHNFGGDFGEQFSGDNDNNGWGFKQPQNFGNMWPAQMGHGGQVSHSGGRSIVSKSTSTKSQTTNGTTKTLKITKIKYSDGTEQQERQETINQ